MARSCTACSHTARASIDQALVAGVGSNRRIAAQHGLTEQAVRRHAAVHLPAALVKAEEANQEQQAIDIVTQLKAINGASLAVLRDARSSGQGELALKAVDRVHRQIELQSKLLGILAEQAAVNVDASSKTFTLSLGEAQPKLSDTDIDQRITVMMQIRDRALRRAEQGDLSMEELVPLVDASVAEYQLAQDDPRASLDRKLARLAARRQGVPAPEPIVLEVPEPVVPAPPPRTQPGPAPARSPHWVAKGW